MNIQTYTQASNAARAAKRTLVQQGIANPIKGEHFDVMSAGDSFVWTALHVEPSEVEQAQQQVQPKFDANGLPILSGKKAVGKTHNTRKAVKKEEISEKAEPLPKQNGMTHPGPGTKTGKIWALCDELVKTLGRCPKFKEMQPQCELMGMHPTTTKVQYYWWRTYHGIKGRV